MLRLALAIAQLSGVAVGSGVLGAADRLASSFPTSSVAGRPTTVRDVTACPNPKTCPVGGVCDASTCLAGFSAADATEPLQSALHSGAALVIVRNMGTPWLITSTLRLAHANQTLQLEAGVVVEAKRWAPFWNATAPVVRPTPLFETPPSGSRNLTVRGAPGAALRMHKADYMNSSLYPFHNEWRHGISIANSEDITLAELRIEQTGGDGIVLSHETSRIVIRNVTVEGAYRNGVTVSSASDLLVEGSTFANTGGTAPGAGVDIEPGAPWTYLRNLVFRNSRFVDNEGPGFQLGLQALMPFNRTAFAGKGCAEDGGTGAARARVPSFARRSTARALSPY